MNGPVWVWVLLAERASATKNPRHVGDEGFGVLLEVQTNFQLPVNRIPVGGGRAVLSGEPQCWNASG